MDAGSAIGSIGETMHFLLEQATAVSRGVFDPTETRPRTVLLWQKACAFKSLFNTDKIQRIQRHKSTYYCCSPRSDPMGDDVRDRATVSAAHAAKVVQAFTDQLEGKNTTVDHLMSFAGGSGSRIFGFNGRAGFCTCPAFYPHRQCFHIVGLSVFLGLVDPPETLDTTAVSMMARGNKRKAPGRGAVPLRADEKDVRIAQLEAKVRKLSGCKTPKRAPEIVQPTCLQKPAKRLRQKTNGSGIACRDSPIETAAQETLGVQQNAAVMLQDLAPRCNHNH